MGHSQADKLKTHERVVSVASRLLREKGLDGIGVADLMKEAGATVGGFYKHFRSRDELVTEAMTAAFGGWKRRAEKPVTFDDLLDEYLTTKHRDDVGGGCAFAACASDLARSEPETRAAARKELTLNVELLTRLTGNRKKAILAYAAMVGAVTMARIAVGDPLSKEILEVVREMLSKR